MCDLTHLCVQYRDIIDQERARESDLLQQLREAAGEVQARHANVKQLDNVCVDISNRRVCPWIFVMHGVIWYAWCGLV
jgi:hypothetical protein